MCTAGMKEEADSAKSMNIISFVMMCENLLSPRPSKGIGMTNQPGSAGWNLVSKSCYRIFANIVPQTFDIVTRPLSSEEED